MKEKIVLHDKTFVPFISNEEIEKAIDELAARMNAEFKGCEDVPVLLCVLNGAILFTAELMKRLDFPVELMSMKLSSYTGTHSSGEVKTVMGLTGNVKDRMVIIVEDIVDTGNTIVKIKPNGRFGKSASISGNIKSVSASSSVVSVLTTNEIVSFSLGNMKEKSRVETDDSVKSICRMGSDVFIHRQSLIDEINTADK